MAILNVKRCTPNIDFLVPVTLTSLSGYFTSYLLLLLYRTTLYAKIYIVENIYIGNTTPQITARI